MLRDIVEKPVEMKDYFSAEAKQILTQLLERNPAKRLGNTSSDASA
jgi:serine/threonine protein kinase